MQEQTTLGRILGARSYEVPNPDDERNRAILAARVTARLESEGPQSGDYIIYPDTPERTGEYERQIERISHDWGDGVQTSPGGSWYLGAGFASFSGSLNSTIPKSGLTDTGEVRAGRFWFFDHDYRRAHAGVEVEAPCRVYRYDGSRYVIGEE